MHGPGTSDRRCASSGGGAKRLRRSFVWRVATMGARQRAACFRCPCHGARGRPSSSRARSEEHTSELQSLMRISYAVFCLKKKKNIPVTHNKHNNVNENINILTQK